MRNKRDQIEDLEFGIDSRYPSSRARKVDGQALMAARLERMKNF